MLNDPIIEKLIEHDEKLGNLVTTFEFADFRKDQSDANDQIITILKRLDEERYATIEWLRRVEKEVEDQKKQTQEHELLLQRLKQELKI